MAVDWTLVIVLGALVGLVILLAAIYAYIYYTKIRPCNKRPRAEDVVGHYHRRETSADSKAKAADQDGNVESAVSHPFMILHYARRLKSDS